MGCYYHFCPCQESRYSLFEEEIQRGIKNRELDEPRKQKIQEKGYNVIEIYECDLWKYTRQTTLISSICVNHSPTDCTSEKNDFWKLSNGRLFVYIQCDIEVSENRCENFDEFPHNLQNINVSRDDIGSLMKAYDKQDFWLNLGECKYQAFCWRLKKSIHRCCSFIWIWGLFAKQFIAFCSTLQWSASKTLLSLQWMLEERETRIQILVFWLRQLS